MSWLRIDDRFWAHPKVDASPLSSIGLWVRAASWAAGYTKDGHVTRAAIRKIGAGSRDIAPLVENRLWVPNGDGFVIHDFGEYTDERSRRGGVARAASAHRDALGHFTSEES